MTIPYRDRIVAVDMVLQGGVNYREAAKLAGVSHASVVRWVKLYRAGRLSEPEEPEPERGSSAGKFCGVCYGISDNRPRVGVCRCGEKFAEEKLR
jgi:Winged helix-turn helix